MKSFSSEEQREEQAFEVARLQEEFAKVLSDPKLWHALVFGRRNSFAYKVALWFMEFFLYHELEGKLFQLCARCLQAPELLRSNFGHLLCQRAVLIVYHVVEREEMRTDEGAPWDDLLDSALFLAEAELFNAKLWQDAGSRNNASHVMNQCTMVAARQPARLRRLVQTCLAREREELITLCKHTSGKYVMRRIYDKMSTEERQRIRQMTGEKVDRWELRPLETFRQTLLPGRLEL